MVDDNDKNKLRNEEVIFLMTISVRSKKFLLLVLKTAFVMFLKFCKYSNINLT